MRRRPEAARTGALAGIALVATALALAGTVQGAGDSAARMAARAWDGVFGDRPAPAAEHRQRVLVVLSSPSLADRLAAAKTPPTAEEQRQWTADADSAQRLLLAGLDDRGVEVERDHVFTRTLNGFSARVTARAVAELERVKGIAGVYPVRTVYPAAESSQELVAGRLSGGAGRAGVSLPGFTGSGVTIALLDTGVDRGHPYLKGRVLPGYDVIEDDRTVAPAEKPGDPTDLEQHGTRMAGLIVGGGGPGGLEGVAPGARVLPIRVMGWRQAEDGSWAVLGRGDQLLAGLERAVDPDADGAVDDHAAIALVGGVEPYAAFADSPEARAVAGAAGLGTLVVAPVGNDGRPGTGFGTVAAPAAASEALAVGALDERHEVLQAEASLAVGGDTVFDDPVRVLGPVAPSAVKLDVAAPVGPTLSEPDRAPGEPAAGDALGDFFGANGASLVAGDAAVVSAEGGSAERRVSNAAAAGAAVVLVASTDLPAGSLELDDAVRVPVLAVPAEAAADVVAGARAGSEQILELSSPESLPNPALMDVAPFSSGGVAFDGRVKPDLVAAGVGLATSDAGGADAYATVTGTSAAAAVVAGAAALVAEARPALSAPDLKSALVGSAGRLRRNDLAVSASSQGGGLVDPAHAATAELAAEPATLAFGRAAGSSWSATRPLAVRNVSSRTLAVSFALVPDDPAGPRLTFSADPARLSLQPGASATVSIGVAADGELPAGAGGVLLVSADGAQPVRVPWTVATRPEGTVPLVGDVQISHGAFAPSDRAPVVLAFRAGRAEQVPDGELIEPVGVLELELWTATGRRLGVLARLRDVLPGRYAFGLTGRGPQGGILPEGEYVLRLRAHPVDGDDGTPPSTAEAVFTITG
jgi:minor extracellular serine protease Vpr